MRLHVSSVVAAAASALLSLSSASLTAQQLVDSPYLAGCALPVAFAFHDDHLLFVAERDGYVRVVDHGNLLPSPMLDLREEVGGWRDFGLLGLALDPSFDTNGYVYVSYVVDRHHLLHYGTPAYSATTDEYFAASIVRVTRFTADAQTGFTTVVPGSRHVLFGETPSTGAVITSETHGSGQLLFGRDGSLLVAIGDGAHFFFGGDFGNDARSYYQQAIADGMMRPEDNVGSWRSQMIGSCNGKILRLDPATGDGVPSNPFFDPQQPRAPRSRVWALGLRQPFKMTLRPGTGSTNPSFGQPGTIYVGDVGWYTREELDVVNEPGQNFGWPMYEGIELSPSYPGTQVENQDAPNPLAGSGCGAYFTFHDLLHQAVEGHSVSFPNPCNPSIEIAANTPTFVHTPPAIDWLHNVTDARVPVFENGVLVARTVGTPESFVSGTPFRGSCSVGGTWHSGLSFPTNYGPCYYHTDFVGGWIKRFEFDATDHLHAVHDLTTALYPVALGESPEDNALLYMQIFSDNLRAVRFNIEPPPVALPTATVARIQGSVEVQLDGRDSYDPQNQALSWLWQLPNGRTSTAPQLGITLRTLGTPQAVPVQLTVTDTTGTSTTATLQVPVENTAPRVEITSFANGDLYSQSTPTQLQLAGTAIDAEHSPTQLSWAWQVTLHHVTHVHPEPPILQPTATTTLSPSGGGAEFFAYSIDLTVTDACGLATTARHWLFPDTTGASTTVLLAQPASGDRVAVGSPILFSAVTTGTVQRVEYRVDGELIGVATAAPWTCTWTPTVTGPLVAMALAVGTDGTASNSRGIPFTVEAPVTTKARLHNSTDDVVEAFGMAQPPIQNQPQLTLGNDGTPWLTGLRFQLPDVPPGARIVSATIDFTAAQTDTLKAHFTVGCEQTPAPRTFQLRPKDVLARKIGTELAWSPAAWTTDASASAQRTPDLGALMQPVVANPGWSHDVVFVVRGLGVRHAWSWDGNRLVAPLLTVRWLPPLPQQDAAPVSADAAEVSSDGSVDLHGSTLPLGNSHVVALQFTLAVPANAVIEGANVQFTAAGVDSGPTVLTLTAEAVDDAAPIAANAYDLSSRPKLPPQVAWYPQAWTVVGDRTAQQRTPDLTTLLAAIMAQPGWMPGQKITLFVEGTGTRTAAAIDAGNIDAPRLEVFYRLP